MKTVLRESVKLALIAVGAVIVFPLAFVGWVSGFTFAVVRTAFEESAGWWDSL